MTHQRFNSCTVTEHHRPSEVEDRLKVLEERESILEGQVTSIVKCGFLRRIDVISAE